MNEKYRWHDVRIECPDFPYNDTKVLCCTETKKGGRNYVIGYYADGRWRCGMNSNVIAWRYIDKFELDPAEELEVRAGAVLTQLTPFTPV